MVWNWKKGKSTLRNRCKNSWGSAKAPGITGGMNCLKISACTMNTMSFTRDVQQNITSSANWVITKSHCQNAVKNCGIRFMKKKFPKKMAPSVSPNKTVIGGVGGLVGGLVGAAVGAISAAMAAMLQRPSVATTVRPITISSLVLGLHFSKS